MLIKKLKKVPILKNFEEFAKTDNYGIIITYMWAFDSPEDWQYLEHVKNIFSIANAEFYYVELVANQEIRLQRNATENRLKNKPSKRDIPTSNQRLIDADKKYRLESFEGEIAFENYIKIDNSNLKADETAQIIKTTFNL